MVNQLTVPCIVCDKPGEPHHEPPKGMGGSEEWKGVIITLCRTHHNERHAGLISFKVEGKIVKTFGGEIQLAERALGTDDFSHDPRWWSTERLRHEWWSAEDSAFDAFIRQCRVAWNFKQRMGWKLGWYKECAAILSQERPPKRNIHWRRVYERLKVYEAFEGHWENFDYLGATLALAVAESRLPDAMEIALQATDDGLKVKEAKALVKPEGVADSATEWVMCPTCGGKGKVRDAISAE